MKAGEFLKKVDDVRVIEAIRSAEAQTSGEIRVFVSRRTLRGDDVVHRAARRFEKLGMTRTRDRNGILLYFVPRDRKFAIIGDAGIHEKCQPAFWAELAADVRRHLAEGQFTEGVLGAVRAAGAALAAHFPRRPDDRDELSNAIGRD